MPEAPGPATSHRREPLKVNIFRAGMTANTALMPVFPYLGPDAIVPCLGVTRKSDGRWAGKFWHENSVDEVGLMVSAAGGFAKPGMVFCTGRTHPVGTFEDEADPFGNFDAYAVTTIVQRHPGPQQRESVTIRCAGCKTRTLYRYRFEFDPEQSGKDGELEVMGSITGAAVTVEEYNGSEELRTCSKCGRVNPPFPVDRWGWADYKAQSEAAEASRRALAEASQEFLQRRTTGGTAAC